MDTRVVGGLPIHNLVPALTVHCVAIVIAAAIPFTARCQETTNHVGLPPAIHEASSPGESNAIRLGQRIFFDKRLSADGTVSCSSCHRPEHAFTDGLPRSRGVGGHTGTRNAPSILNAALVNTQFWDGREPSLETQALEPFVNPVEQGLNSLDSLLGIIRGDMGYVDEFRAAFGATEPAITTQHIAQALASFERSLVVGDSALDRYYFGGDKTALSPEAVRGFLLFVGRARCSSCHTIDPLGAPFTDGQFHTLHVGMSRIDGRLAELTQRVIKSRNHGDSVSALVLGNDEIAQLGRFVVTLSPDDIGKFRTPSLRNVALTAPYMHDGSVATLEEAVDQEIYYRTAQSGNPLILTPKEKHDLISFLGSLTSSTALSKLKN
ncbi:cytochrome-c peroxidase [Burkholderia pseudomallei]|uniref:cytochrome-c peroxidase n=1 Tax=Burkholderia pseudomallei TaxID=28450 RepID=UPI0005380E64|nr:cytochrome c peroxidase [Burkholderia pseudomallei]KGV19652.1 cytochrome c family protein [Burkholderia pseudomallei TSV 43]KGV31378.1 cytochrome c family protein [Burkholderia pseudomallei TSV 31]